MIRQAYLIILFLLFNSYAFAQNNVKGFVYNDANNDGRKNSNEQGVEGVAVSNGLDVVLTDSRGYYNLQIDNDDIIFVVKPSGYNLPVNDLNQPQFYYIYKPGGSPYSRYKGVSPTGRLPESVDFPLLAANENENFKILVLGDTQARDNTEVDYFERDIVSELINTREYEFGIILGDNAYDDLNVLKKLNETTAKVGIPWYNVIGNHDKNVDSKEIELADETYESVYGPATFSYNIGKVHFIVFDDIMYPDPRDGRGYVGGLTLDQLKFIENDLKFVPKDNLVVMMMHIHMFTWTGRNSPFRVEDRQTLFNLLKDYPNTLSMSAHTHVQQQYFFDRDEGWQQENPHHHYNVGTSCGDWWSGEIKSNNVPEAMMSDGTPNGYAILSFTGNQYVIDYKAAGYPAEKVMHIHAPKAVRNDRSFGIPFYVNIYMGNEKCKVEYRIDNSDWSRARIVLDQDPARVYAQYQWDMSEDIPKGLRPVTSGVCRHLWGGEVDKRLSNGEHTIEVRVTDMFGRVFTEKAEYKIIN